jgi:hypothetical protein
MVELCAGLEYEPAMFLKTLAVFHQHRTESISLMMKLEINEYNFEGMVNTKKNKQFSLIYLLII